MNDMKKEHLDFLEYILPILYREYPGKVMLKSLETEYNKDNEIQLNELSHLYELYDGNYFQIMIQKDFCKLTAFGKDIIENYGSLSKYLEFENEKLEEQNEKQREIESLNKRIIELSITNLELQNRKLKREIWIVIISFILGAIMANLKDILTMLRTIMNK
jgi:hypothetical protein